MISALQLPPQPGAYADTRGHNAPHKFTDPNGIFEAEIQRLAALSSCQAGVCAIHLETGREASWNAEVAFPIASVLKVPLAVEVLAQAEEGSLDLNALVEVKAGDLRSGSGLLQMMFTQPRINLSILSLLELTLTVSDSSAADILLALVGGTEQVNARLVSLGLYGTRLHRSIARMIHDFDEDPERFRSDPRDIATPSSLASLLASIWHGKALSPASAEILFQAMRRCQTGQLRIPGMLPLRTEVAHKTGTIGSVVNDVGVITLPDQSHVALAVFTFQTSSVEAERDRAIAEIARAVFDFFLFTS
ncbi:MAG: class A beta-lactamase [Bryobacterales bacterium]|nr:class A beta-lactamase [Bryobacterales bacterium]